MPMEEKSAVVDEQPKPIDQERLQIRDLIALTPAERVRVMVDSSRNLMALLQKMRIQ